MTDPTIGDAIADAVRWPRPRLSYGRGNGLRLGLHTYWLDDHHAGAYLTLGYDGGDPLVSLDLEPILIRSPRLEALIDRWS